MAGPILASDPNTSNSCLPAIRQTPLCCCRRRLCGNPERHRSHLVCERDAVVIAIDADDNGSTHELRAERGATSDQTLRKDDHGIADLHTARLRAADTGGSHVGQQDYLLVGDRNCQAGSAAGVTSRGGACPRRSDYGATTLPRFLPPISRQAVFRLTNNCTFIPRRLLRQAAGPYDAFAAGLGDHRIVTTLLPRQQGTDAAPDRDGAPRQA